MGLRAELSVADLGASARFYVDVLGFTLDRSDTGYVSVGRDGIVLGLAALADRPPAAEHDAAEDGVRAGRGAGVELVLELDGGPAAIDALYEHALGSGAVIAAPPEDGPSGQRAVRLVDPDGYVLRVTPAADAVRLAVASTPPPPYTAVIFTSVRTPFDESGYGETAAAMERLAAEQPGYLGIESARHGLGITVSYWAGPADAKAWKAVAEHRLAQRLGREQWYRCYRVRVATVDSEYGLG
jgi:heme-degrading monooxygenase HmoA/predicted enzyme related to lactoylglutathione lyase